MPEATEINDQNNDQKEIAGILQLWEELEKQNAQIQDLQEENRTLCRRLNVLTQFCEANLGNVPPEDEYFAGALEVIAKRRDSRDGQRVYVSELKDRMENQIVPAINRLLQSRGTTTTSGKITAKRIKELDNLLKERNGALPFKVIENRLGLKPNQLTRLVKGLDMRKYEVVPKPGSPREKVLRIKARWS